MFAVEVAPQLVARFSAEEQLDEPVFDNFRSALLTMVLKRCNDKAPTVRTRALTVLATILSSPNATYSALLAKISKELVRCLIAFIHLPLALEFQFMFRKSWKAVVVLK